MLSFEVFEFEGLAQRHTRMGRGMRSRLLVGVLPVFALGSLVPVTLLRAEGAPVNGVPENSGPES